MRRMREFNIPLLGKWCWRMLVDRDGLWYKVLVACYGQEGGILMEGGWWASSCWRDVARVRDVSIKNARWGTCLRWVGRRGSSGDDCGIGRRSY